MSSFTITRKNSSSRAPVLGAVLLNMGLVAGYLFIWLVGYQRDMFWRADFTAFYTGAKIVLSGEGSQLYDLETQAQVQSEALQGYIEPGSLAMRYVNPPYLAVVMAPLALLPRQTAFLVWTLIQLVVAAWYIRLLWQLTDGWSRTARWITLSAALAIPSMLLNFMLGSFSLFMLCCLLEFYSAIRNQHEKRAGIWLAISALKPQNVLLESVFLVASRHWMALWSAVVNILLLAAGTSRMLGTQVFPDYVKLLLSHGSLYDQVSVDPAAMYNLKGALTLILASRYGSTINFVSYAALAASALFVFWLWWFSYPRHRDRFHLYLAVTSLLGLIFSPHLNPQDGLLMVFPVLMFYIHLRDHEQDPKWLAVLASISPVLFLAAEFGLGASLHFRLPFAGMIALLIWMIWVWAKDNPPRLREGAFI